MQDDGVSVGMGQPVSKTAALAEHHIADVGAVEIAQADPPLERRKRPLS